MNVYKRFPGRLLFVLKIEYKRYTLQLYCLPYYACMGNIFIAALAAASIASALVCVPAETPSVATVYSENCAAKYELISARGSEALVEKATGNTVARWSEGKSPYSKFSGEYMVYVEDPSYGVRYVGIQGEELIDLETGAPIETKEKMISDIHSELEGLEFNEIPINAHFCECSYYFEHWGSEQIGDNQTGTCTIVAAQILFNYFDSIWRDDVIEEKYDLPVSGPYYYPFSFNQSPGSDGDAFHQYLLKLANDYLGISIEENGATILQQNHFINYYIGSVRGLQYKNNTSEGNWSDIFSGRQFGVVKQAINFGRPVIVNNLRHSMVAFAYDDTYMYLMSGWRSDMIKRMTWDSYNGNIFNNICGAYELIPYSAHDCSNNYYSTILGEYLCPFGIDE